MQCPSILNFLPAIAAAIACFPIAADAQLKLEGRAWVVSDAGATANPRVRLTLVELATGAATAVGRFSGDRLIPLALAVDPVQDDVILALANGTHSDLRRVRLHGTSVTNTWQLASISGRVLSLMIGTEGDVFATVRGGNGDGIYRVARNGGAARRILALPSVSVLAPTEVGTANHAIIGRDSSGAQSASGSLLALAPPVLSQQTTFANQSSLRLSGIGLAIEGASSYVTFSDDRGRLFFTRLGASLTPRQISTVPPLAATATQRVRYLGGAALGIGAAPTASLWWLPGGINGGAVRTIVGALPGSPVDFDHDEFRRRGTLVGYGRACPSGTAQPMSSAGPPPYAPGNANFELQVWRFAAGTPFVVALGIDDQQWQSARLPLPLAPSCSLFLSPTWTLPGVTDASGARRIPLPLPALASLRGTTFMGQAVGLLPRIHVTSAWSIRIAR